MKLAFNPLPSSHENRAQMQVIMHYSKLLNDAAFNANYNQVMDVLRNNICCAANVMDAEGRLPLQSAAHGGSAQIISLLLEARADCNKRQESGSGPTALQIASHTGHTAACRVLLEAKADVNRSDDNGITPMHAAASTGHEYVVEMLLAKSADVNQRTSEGLTASQIAGRESNKRVYEVLQKKMKVHRASPSTESAPKKAVEQEEGCCMQLGHMVRAMCTDFLDDKTDVSFRRR